MQLHWPDSGNFGVGARSQQNTHQWLHEHSSQTRPLKTDQACLKVHNYEHARKSEGKDKLDPKRGLKKIKRRQNWERTQGKIGDPHKRS